LNWLVFKAGDNEPDNQGDFLNPLGRLTQAKAIEWYHGVLVNKDAADERLRPMLRQQPSGPCVSHIFLSFFPFFPSFFCFFVFLFFFVLVFDACSCPAFFPRFVARGLLFPLSCPQFCLFAAYHP
jgi:hypothetical protein